MVHALRSESSCYLRSVSQSLQISLWNKVEIACLEPCLTCSFLPNVLLFLEFYPRESRLTAVVETFHSQRLPPAARSLHSLLYFPRNGVERETFQPNLTAAGVVKERGRQVEVCMHAYGVLHVPN